MLVAWSYFVAMSQHGGLCGGQRPLGRERLGSRLLQ